MENLPVSIMVTSENSASHLQGIAIDKNREYIYCSFTTCLIKYDMNGNMVGSVNGICGHLGCIAYNSLDGRVYGSLEFKNDEIGKGILKNLGYIGEIKDGFYIACFDVDKIDRINMDAEKDGIMKAVFLGEVYDDYSAKGHHLGCSGIDGITFAPSIGEEGEPSYLYVAYGIYGDVSRTDNDYQVILKYDISNWDKYALALDQLNMHRRGPKKPNGKYFVYTGNTTYGIQNLEYDSVTKTMIAAVYCGQKEGFPNYSMFFIDCTQKPQAETLIGVGEEGDVIPLTDLGSGICDGQICGSRFPHGSAGIAGIGEGRFYIATTFQNEKGHGGNIDLYKFDCKNLNFIKL